MYVGFHPALGVFTSPSLLATYWLYLYNVTCGPRKLVQQVQLILNKFM